MMVPVQSALTSVAHEEQNEDQDGAVQDFEKLKELVSLGLSCDHCKKPGAIMENRVVFFSENNMATTLEKCLSGWTKSINKETHFCTLKYYR